MLKYGNKNDGAIIEIHPLALRRDFPKLLNL